MKCQLGDLAVNYKTFGEGRPLVVISGIPSDHQISLSWLEPIFATRPGWQRIYFDLPGTGLTPAGGITTIDQVLDVVCDFIEQIVPAQPFTLLGLSAGGYLARGVVHRKPEQIGGLCLLVPWLSEHDDDDLPAHTSIVRDSQAMGQLSPEDAEKLAGLAVVQNQKVVDWYRNVVLAARQHGEGLALEQFTFSFDLNTASAPFEKPTLILAGRQDAHVGYRDTFDIIERYPRATLAILDRAGHALGAEQENLFHVLLNEWLDRVEEQNLLCWLFLFLLL
jgi:pimeloyl-ACP methyl ester carboxylesterase